MKRIIVFLSILYFCSAAPVPSPKADPSLVYTTPLVAAPAISYSNIYRPPPLYSAYTPYIYNVGYASAYPYGSYPYYVIH